MRDYICINFGVYDAFLSEVMLGSAILHSSESLPAHMGCIIKGTDPYVYCYSSYIQANALK